MSASYERNPKSQKNIQNTKLMDISTETQLHTEIKLLVRENRAQETQSFRKIKEPLGLAQPRTSTLRFSKNSHAVCKLKMKRIRSFWPSDQRDDATHPLWERIVENPRSTPIFTAYQYRTKKSKFKRKFCISPE